MSSCCTDRSMICPGEAVASAGWFASSVQNKASSYSSSIFSVYAMLDMAF
jgi:hypothetical protein